MLRVGGAVVRTIHASGQPTNIIAALFEKAIVIGGEIDGLFVHGGLLALKQHAHTGDRVFVYEAQLPHLLCEARREERGRGFFGPGRFRSVTN